MRRTAERPSFSVYAALLMRLRRTVSPARAGIDPWERKWNKKADEETNTKILEELGE